MNKVKTFANSYLYTRIPDYERNILNFIMKSDRIDKNSESFTGIIEDTKRRQTSAVISRVLMRDDVVLCISSKPMPASFKIFACKDLKTDSKVKVFIDCSGLIVMKNGFMTCNKIDIFCTYLLSAMTMIIYHSEPNRLTNNSSIVQNGADCFVSLSSHIFDYLRLNGYAENRSKISYILAMYFQVSMLGLNREDTSVKNLAAKIAGIQYRDINAMEIYYNDEDLINIDTILNCITSTFKTKGMTTDVFVDKWNWFYGTGTHFACELFTSFSTMITNAYCGSYVNNQKTIEKCCGKSMVEFTNTILRIGSDTIDVGFRYESSIDRSSFNRSITVTQESIFNKKISKEMRITVADLEGDKNKLASKIKILANNGYKNDKDCSKGMRDIYLATIGTVCREFLTVSTKKNYNKMISTVVKTISKYLKSKEKDYIISGLSKTIINLNRTDIKKYPNSKDILSDCKVALKILDPKNVVLSERCNINKLNVVKESDWTEASGHKVYESGLYFLGIPIYIDLPIENPTDNDIQIVISNIQTKLPILNSLLNEKIDEFIHKNGGNYNGFSSSLEMMKAIKIVEVIFCQYDDKCMFNIEYTTTTRVRTDKLIDRIQNNINEPNITYGFISIEFLSNNEVGRVQLFNNSFCVE